MSTTLPAWVPFRDPVQVCSSCRKVACRVHGHLRCPAYRADDSLPLIGLPLSEVQAAALEHPGYWKGDPADDADMPIDLVALGELIRDQRDQPDPNWGDRRSIILGYLTEELGIDPAQVAAAMAKEWPIDATEAPGAR